MGRWLTQSEGIAKHDPIIIDIAVRNSYHDQKDEIRLSQFCTLGYNIKITPDEFRHTIGKVRCTKFGHLK